MSSTVLSEEERREFDLYQEVEALIKKTPWCWQSIGSLLGLAGCVIAPLLGAVADIITWFVNSTFVNSYLHVLSIVLCALTLPSLLFGAVCLELLRRKSVNQLFVAFILISFLCLGAEASAQQLEGCQTNPATASSVSWASESKSTETARGKPIPDTQLVKKEVSVESERDRVLLERIERLEQRLFELELHPNYPSSNRQTLKAELRMNSLTSGTATGEARTISDPQQIGEDERDFFRDTTFNLIIDGYYGYNFNRPAGGINLLRAYDVTSNSFSLNQAAIIIERAPNLEVGQRYGLRLDLQYGQATETMQGSAANEPRPQAYRPLWQAYGTYIFPVGKGLTVDFGKFAGSLGYETNYTKDNFNYSRSYYFNFLPFYHFGIRAKLPLNDKLAVAYHLINGTQQSEDFNGFKSHHIALLLTPTKRVSGQINYYFGREQRDRIPTLNPTLASLPTQPGLSTDLIRPVPTGALHIFDTYYTFNVTDRWTLAVESDYVIGRVFRESSPSTVWGGAGYARYQFTPRFAFAGRFEYLAERVSSTGGLFSGSSQALKEHTLTAEYKFAEGFLVRLEYRRDFSNQPFFLSERQGVLKKEQTTATFGLVWWLGRKKGSW